MRVFFWYNLQSFLLGLFTGKVVKFMFFGEPNNSIFLREKIFDTLIFKKFSSQVSSIKYGSFVLEVS
jgi:hypothetical protein